MFCYSLHPHPPHCERHKNRYSQPTRVQGTKNGRRTDDEGTCSSLLKAGQHGVAVIRVNKNRSDVSNRISGAVNVVREDEGYQYRPSLVSDDLTRECLNVSDRLARAVHYAALYLYRLHASKKLYQMISISVIPPLSPQTLSTIDRWRIAFPPSLSPSSMPLFCRSTIMYPFRLPIRQCLDDSRWNPNNRRFHRWHR